MTERIPNDDLRERAVTPPPQELPASPAGTEESIAARTPPPVAGSRPFDLQRVVKRINFDVFRLRPRLMLVQLVVSLIPRMSFAWLRPALYRLAGFRIGDRTCICGKLEVEGEGNLAEKVSIGESCMFTTPLYLNASGGITIGNHVVIGHHSMIITTTHEMDSPDRRCGDQVMRPVVIEDGVWIAARATILPGVTLGAGCVIAAGAVVTANVPPHTLVAGVPARHIRHLPR